MKLLKLTLPVLLPIIAAVIFAAALSSCEVSADSVTATLSDSANDNAIYNFSGMYINTTTSNDVEVVAPLVYPYEGNQKPSGELITFLRLLQYGSELEGYDSAGLTWYGSISSISEKTANFTLSGRTTVGTSVEIAGTLIYSENNSGNSSTLNATWIEPTYYGNIYGIASVAPAATNTSTSVSISPTSVTLTSSSTSQVFTASGGNGSYTWTHNSSCGKLVSTTGSSIQYNRLTTGNDTLTVTSDGESDSAHITCQ